MNTATLTDADDARTECDCQTTCTYRACPVNSLIAAIATARGLTVEQARVQYLGGAA